MSKTTNADYKVLIADDSLRPDGIDLLRERASLVLLPPSPSEKDLVAAVQDVDAILSRCAIISRPVVAAAQKLKIVSRHGPMTVSACEACAKACDVCAAACGKHPEDQHMKRCAKACQDCAKACRDMVKHTADVAK